MRQGLKASWQDFPEPVGAASSATVLPFETPPRRAAPSEHRSDVTEIMAVLSGAAEEIRAANARAAEIEHDAHELADRLVAAEERARVAETEAASLAERLRATETSLRLSERKFHQLSDWHAQQLADAEDEIARARSVATQEEHHRAVLQRSSAEQDEALRYIVDDAGNRIYAAEIRAAEAARDFEALRDYVRANFSR